MNRLNRLIGNYGELLATNYLIDNNYVILSKNFYSPFGEIDIVSRENNYICFIEVKTRYSKKFGTPAEYINRNKIKHLIKCANYYLLQNHLTKNFCRFDVLEVVLSHDTNNIEIHHIKNAF